MGTEAAQAQWLEEKVEGWRALVAIMARVAGNHPQSASMVLQKSLHQEWALMQRVTLDIGTAFQPVEDVMRATFLPDLLQYPRESGHRSASQAG